MILRMILGSWVCGGSPLYYCPQTLSSCLYHLGNGVSPLCHGAYLGTHWAFGCLYSSFSWKIWWSEFTVFRWSLSFFLCFPSGAPRVSVFICLLVFPRALSLFSLFSSLFFFFSGPQSWYFLLLCFIKWVDPFFCLLKSAVESLKRMFHFSYCF